MKQDEVLLETDLFSSAGLYLYLWPIVLAIVAVVIWGVNIYLGNSVPHEMEKLTPWMLPAAAVLAGIGTLLYFRLRGKLLLQRFSGRMTAVIRMPGKEEVLLDPVAHIVFTRHSYYAGKGTHHLDRYATFLNSRNEPVFRVLLSGRAFSGDPDGYMTMDPSQYAGVPLYRGNPEQIRRAWMKYVSASMA